jgi:hypothetical protein
MTSPDRFVPIPLRDARPFLAFHLRACAERADETHGDRLSLLARWVENLPADMAPMRRIEATEALDYSDGSWHGGPEAEGLIDSYSATDEQGSAAWLEAVAAATERFWECQA